MVDYVPRFVDDLLGELLEELSAIMVLGPRACGKTTSAVRRARTVVRLDDPDQAAPLRAAPDAVLRTLAEPVLLDEWQEVPQVVGAVKRSVDTVTGAGRYILTGSVRARESGALWAGTGRIVPIDMWGLTQAELSRSPGASHALGELLSGDPLGTSSRPQGDLSDLDVTDYVALALRGGFPEAIELGARARDVWMRGYVDQLVHQDARQIADVRSPDRLGAVLHAVALSTAGVPNETTLSRAAGVDVRTVRGYLDLLEDLRVVERLPAWHSNRLSRLVKVPKYYVVDPGLAASVIGVDVRAILASGDLLGRVVDTFVVAQLRPLLALGDPVVSMSHLRDRGGEHEVDIVLETRSGEIIAIEVKAAGRAEARDAKHLVWLREQVGNAFRCGVVFHTGPAAYPIDDRIVALPISWLWADR